MQLTKVDGESEVWGRVVTILKARRQELLESLGMDRHPDITTQIRGRLREVEDLLTIGDPPDVPKSQ